MRFLEIVCHKVFVAEKSLMFDACFEIFSQSDSKLNIYSVHHFHFKGSQKYTGLPTLKRPNFT